jgi:hypothetical protein
MFSVACFLLSAFAQKPLNGSRNLARGGVSPNLLLRVKINAIEKRTERTALTIFMRMF